MMDLAITWNDLECRAAHRALTQVEAVLLTDRPPLRAQPIAEVAYRAMLQHIKVPRTAEEQIEGVARYARRVRARLVAEWVPGSGATLTLSGPEALAVLIALNWALLEGWRDTDQDHLIDPDPWLAVNARLLSRIYRLAIGMSEE